MEFINNMLEMAKDFSKKEFIIKEFDLDNIEIDNQKLTLFQIVQKLVLIDNNKFEIHIKKVD